MASTPACAYFTPLIGGIIADRVTRQESARSSLGGSVMALGHFMMTLEPLFYVALATIAIGNGLFLPQPAESDCDLYERGDPRAGRAYNVYYVGVNIGGFLAPLMLRNTWLKPSAGTGVRAAGVGMVHRSAVLSLGSTLSSSSGAAAPRRAAIRASGEHGAQYAPSFIRRGRGRNGVPGCL
jgi:POT family proton-dependent oligopeptide transporter